MRADVFMVGGMSIAPPCLLPSLLGATILLGGCAPTGPYPVPVQGTVAFDGKPLDAGKISFITLGQVPEPVDIHNGKFVGQAKWGARRVEIAAYRPYQIPPEIPASMHSMMQDGKENYLPEKYHKQSTLTVDIQQRGKNEFSFELSSQ